MIFKDMVAQGEITAGRKKTSGAVSGKRKRVEVEDEDDSEEFDEGEETEMEQRLVKVAKKAVKAKTLVRATTLVLEKRKTTGEGKKA